MEVTIKIKIEGMTHDDLVNLLSTALYVSSHFSASYDREFYNKNCELKESDCIEDRLAKVLLAGGKIFIYDHYAEDEEEKYGNLPSKWDECEQAMVYEVTLADILNNLSNAFNTNKYARKIVLSLKDDASEFDFFDADYLLQLIVFQEYIYG